MTRSYETRHGNGPMFREHSRLDLSVDYRNSAGSFAGNFRQGDLNIPYILSLSGKFDILAVTCLDHHEINTNLGFPIVIESRGPEATDKTIVYYME